ncbi:MAG TPA: NAD(P)/FAD-dependent oxidoreductase [Opitutaceae bacterium]|nr:NAD(P)/FAD-dependent oxidoreductase [Opitutaceae bacterium]
MYETPLARLPHIVVVGAGFGGLTFCQRFPSHRARITLVDRQNHHLFQPLLYQVATAGLSGPDIAQPIRSILAKKPNLTVLMERVVDFDLAGQSVFFEKTTFPYDYLVLALGGVTSYFGHNDWEQYAPGLKSLEDAIRIRRQTLLAFERAEAETDPARRAQWMTTVVVGGGATGVEMAGAISELARNVLASDFHRIDPRQARVILLEGLPRILAHLPPDLSASAQRQLEALGVEVKTDTLVKAIRSGEVELERETIRAGNIVWAAGVAANPLTKKMGAETDRAGRIKILADLSLPGHPEVFAVGDMVTLVDKNGVTVPGVSPAAIQMATHAAKIIEAEIERGKTAPANRPPFAYRDKGTMATIGRSKAVAMVGKLKFSGFPAWLAWLVVHLVFLIGFRNKVAVLFSWIYSYFTYKRGARVIVGGS